MMLQQKPCTYTVVHMSKSLSCCCITNTSFSTKGFCYCSDGSLLTLLIWVRLGSFCVGSLCEWIGGWLLLRSGWSRKNGLSHMCSSWMVVSWGKKGAWAMSLIKQHVNMDIKCLMHRRSNFQKLFLLSSGFLRSNTSSKIEEQLF